MTWICSTCGRQFRNTNQDHSCLITDLESHFVNKQQNVIDTFEKIKNEVMQLEGVQINSVKNAILFQTKSIEFVLDEKVDEFPIYKTFQATKSKYAHFVRLESPEEVDEQLILWLRKAYKISSE
jgi:hypothetical protein